MVSRSYGVPALVALVLCMGCGDGSESASTVAAEAQRGYVVELAHPDRTDDHDALLAAFPGAEMRRLGNSSFFVLEVPRDFPNLDALLTLLQADPRLRDAQPDYVGSSPEGGPSTGSILGGDLIASIATQPGLAAIGLDEARGLADGAGVVVAILDTGIDYAHPYLADATILPGYDLLDFDGFPQDERNGVDDDGDGEADRQYGHGTFVASLVKTIAPRAAILPIRVLDDEGFGHTSKVAQGIYLAVASGAHVVNVSIDIGQRPSVLQDAVDFAEAMGVLVVGAAGNAATSNIAYPAKESTVVAVAAVDDRGVAAEFTNYGRDVALSAPGVTLIGAAPFDKSPTGTVRWSGTSFAAPVVSAAAALARSRGTGAVPADMRAHLAASAIPIDALNPERAGDLGAGLLDLAAVAR